MDARVEHYLLPRPRSAELTAQRAPNVVLAEQLDSGLAPSGYAIEVCRTGALLRGGDQAGLFYGRQTLRQLARLCDGRLPVGVIADHPDIAIRGVMLDISRDKVPTMATLRDLIARLASWKINHVQLYCEHVFTYRNHASVHAGASPFTADEIRSLDAFCTEHHVELAANQNCLGHMNRWLRLDAYQELALAPAGFRDPSGMQRPPMTLDPRDPRSLALVRELLAELLPLFKASRVHVGLDEAWEIGPQDTHLFMDWIRRLRELPELRGHEMLMWGDMLTEDLLFRRLPAGVTVCEWGYEADHPFERRAAALHAAEVPFWVCPGTSTWLSLVGRLSNALENCRSAAAAARLHGGAGYLLTDWGDQGHHQYLPISEPLLAYGAAVSWCLETNADLPLAAVLSRHCFDDPSEELAKALLVLGDLYLQVTPRVSNASSLVRHLYYPQSRVGHGHTLGMTLEELSGAESRLQAARAHIERARSARSDAELVSAELRQSIDLVALLITDAKARLVGDGTLASVPAAIRHQLAAKLLPLMQRHRGLWLARNREGGLRDSLTWLENLHDAYMTGEPIPDWGGTRD